jgi:two-component system NarL family sensor kinase
LTVKKGIEGKPVLTNIYVHLSRYYESIRQNNLAFYYSEKGLKEAEHSKVHASIIVALNRAIVVNKDKSKEYLEKYNKIINDSQLEERKSKDHFDKIQLEVNEITEEKETAIKQKWIIGSISVIIIMIIILLLVITWQRSKQKELKFMQNQQQANEEIYDLMLAQKNQRRGSKTRRKK